jgi:hypothetical protein
VKGSDMSANKSSISQAQSYQEMGEFWDSHDVTDYWEETEPVEFEVDIQSEVRYCALERTLVSQVSEIAWQKGVSIETLVNLWIQEKVKEELTEVTAA